MESGVSARGKGIWLWAGLVLLTACARPLSPSETAFATALFGESLDVQTVRTTRGFGFAPLPATEVVSARQLTPRENACDRTAPTPRRGPIPAFALFHRIHYSQPYYSQDVMVGWPNAVRMPHALLFAHEMVHVWQWQNRQVTGYSPLAAARESWVNVDPYFYNFDPERPFASYGFEQQAALVEDYICYRFLDPTAPRLGELRAVLEPVFPLAELERALFPAGAE